MERVRRAAQVWRRVVVAVDVVIKRAGGGENFPRFFLTPSGTDREGKKNSNGRRREVKKKHEKRTVVIDIDERTMSTAGVGALGRNVCKKGGES